MLARTKIRLVGADMPEGRLVYGDCRPGTVYVLAEPVRLATLRGHPVRDGCVKRYASLVYTRPLSPMGGRAPEIT